VIFAIEVRSEASHCCDGGSCCCRHVANLALLLRGREHSGKYKIGRSRPGKRNTVVLSGVAKSMGCLEKMPRFESVWGIIQTVPTECGEEPGCRSALFRLVSRSREGCLWLMDYTH
jgi:hypothetical protein